jgi:hypothetical protein
MRKAAKAAAFRSVVVYELEWDAGASAGATLTARV